MLIGEFVNVSELLNVFGIKKLLIVLIVEMKFSVVVVLVVVLCIVCLLEFFLFLCDLLLVYGRLLKLFGKWNYYLV